LFSTPFSNTLSLCSSIHATAQFSLPYKTTCKLYTYSCKCQCILFL
jgi:hypothetical protein